MSRTPGSRGGGGARLLCGAIAVREAGSRRTRRLPVSPSIRVPPWPYVAWPLNRPGRGDLDEALDDWQSSPDSAPAGVRRPCGRADVEGTGLGQAPGREVGAVQVGGERPGGLGQPHEERREHRPGAGHHQAEQGDHDREVLPPGGAGLRAAGLADEYSRDADRGPVRQERADLPRRAGDHGDRPDPDAVRRSRPHGVNTSKGPMMYKGVIAWDAYEHGAGGRVVGMGPLGVEHPGELGFVCRGVVLDAVAYKKSKGVIPAGAEMLPIPTKPGDAGIVTADDVRGMLQMQGLRDIAPGDCVALHTGQGNSWSNDRYKSMNSAQRKAARDLFDQGEPGFVRRAALGGAGARLRGALPHGDADPPGHLEPGERRHQVARRQEDPRGRVHLGAAADHWRHRLARQSDGALLGTWGAPKWPPIPPNARRAPAKPWRASIPNARRAAAKPWRASTPNARRAPAKPWRASTSNARGAPGEPWRPSILRQAPSPESSCGYGAARARELPPGPSPRRTRPPLSAVPSASTGCSRRSASRAARSAW